MPVFADLHTGFGKVEKRVCECVCIEKKKAQAHGGQAAWVTGHLISTHTHTTAHSPARTHCKLSKIQVT